MQWNLWVTKCSQKSTFAAYNKTNVLMEKKRKKKRKKKLREKNPTQNKPRVLRGNKI